MKTMRSLVAIASLATAAVAAPAFVGCTAPTTHANAESAGSLSVAMTAVGPDGATYSLMNSALHVAWTNDAGSSDDNLYFNSSAGSQSWSMPVGTYTATLLGAAPDAQAGWTLTRVGDGGATTVQAALIDPQPYTFTISPGQTTPLVLHFEIAGVGDITFASGSLTTTLSVDAGTFPPGHASIAGTPTFTQAYLSAMPSLTPLLGVSSAAPQTVPMTLALNLTSPFEFQPTQTCANVSGSVSATANPDGGVEDGVADLINEVQGGNGILCFLLNGHVRLIFQRIGVPRTATYQAALGSSAQEMFTVQILGTGPQVFANGTLALSRLAQPFSLSAFDVDAGFQPTGGGSGAGVSAFSGNVTLQITP